MNLVNILNKIFPRCFQECQAKEVVRSYFDQFDEEQKIEMAHHMSHQIGNYDFIVKILLAAFILQTIYFSMLFYSMR